MEIRSVAVFCGSHSGNNPVFADHVAEMGKLLTMLNVKIIYGGGHRGLMGVLADSVLKNEGRIMGIIPEMLVEIEAQHKGLSELAVVTDMHSRKKMMYERCDAVIVLPGGYGTMDEMFEMLTWNQLKIHDKKIYVLNSEGFYDPIRKQIKKMQEEGFLAEEPMEKIIFCGTPIELFNIIS